MITPPVHNMSTCTLIDVLIWFPLFHNYVASVKQSNYIFKYRESFFKFLNFLISNPKQTLIILDTLWKFAIYSIVDTVINAPSLIFELF